MADANTSDGASGANQEGVLANLPRTRPQRSSPRRAAARNSAGAAATPAGERPRGGARRPTQPARKPTSASGRSSAKRAQEAPQQGFESDSEAASSSVHPPGAVELVASAAEIVGELAKAGLSRSERLMKDLISRLPLN